MKRAISILLAVAFASSQSALAELPLFASNDDLNIIIEAPLRTVVRKKEDRPVVEGFLRYTDENGELVSIGMTLTTRGKSRLEHCSFPPLSMNLKRKQTVSTIFEGQNKLKIVTHCRNGGTYERYLQQEFGIYRAFSVFTDLSFRVRWLTITYRDTERDNKEDVRMAFFIESDNEVADRHGMEKLQPDTIDAVQLDPTHANLYSLFQLLIANTDWSMIRGPAGDGCCHNGKVIIEPGSTSGWIVLPYDFDQAGLIYTKYSMPADALKIRNVKQRIFRGRCINIGELDKNIAAFNEQRTEVETALMGKVENEKSVKSMQKYIGDFYEIINDPKETDKKITSKCSGTREPRS
jgi:hypothetical protein